MARERILPDNATLRRWRIDEGMSVKEITERVYQETGHKIGSSTVSVALARAGISPSQPRYKEELPWIVRAEHAMDYPARMLRGVGRVRSGGQLNPDEDARLRSWLERLEKHNAVVAYDPDYGFFLVEADQDGDRPDGIPIRPGVERFSDYD